MDYIQPYQFEPLANEDESARSIAEDALVIEKQKRLENTEWCTCGNCKIMQSFEECLCCTEVADVISTRDRDAEITGEFQCITDHPGFHANCLDVWALQMARKNTPKKFLTKEAKSMHE
ncbi:uncharacterized protein [Antedon mediterranea]|uniref:uncharacterized protein n=1 Tax=Antedon mediterranea TaxID=105859 RepID=UPI003AF85D32